MGNFFFFGAYDKRVGMNGCPQYTILLTRLGVVSSIVLLIRITFLRNVRIYECRTCGLLFTILEMRFLKDQDFLGKIVLSSHLNMTML